MRSAIGEPTARTQRNESAQSRRVRPHDLQISPADLNELVRKGPHGPMNCQSCLPRLESRRAISRRSSRWCSTTWSVSARGHKRECDADLAAGSSAEHYRECYLNASTIADLKKPANQ